VIHNMNIPPHFYFSAVPQGPGFSPGFVQSFLSEAPSLPFNQKTEAVQSTLQQFIQNCDLETLSPIIPFSQVFVKQKFQEILSQCSELKQVIQNLKQNSSDLVS